MPPTLLLRTTAPARAVPLAASTLVGRHWACLARADDPRVPLLWLELRWFGTRWGWRALGALERTRGKGAALEDGWRHLAPGTPVRLDDALVVELADDSAPVPMLVNPENGRLAPPDVLERLVELRDDRLLPMDAEGDPARALPDGALLVDDTGHPWRVCLPDAPAPTAQARVDLSRAYDLFLDDDLLRATFVQGPASVAVVGEGVRVLAAYEEARRADLPRGGWLTPVEAWDAWVARGGNPESPVARLGWERAKLRTALARHGVSGLDALFEIERGQQIRLRWSG